jgi:hypothetical protein
MHASSDDTAYEGRAGGGVHHFAPSIPNRLASWLFLRLHATHTLIFLAAVCRLIFFTFEKLWNQAVASGFWHVQQNSQKSAVTRPL